MKLKKKELKKIQGGWGPDNIHPDLDINGTPHSNETGSARRFIIDDFLVIKQKKLNQKPV